METKNPKNQEGKPKEQYPTNHRIRPKDMTITQAAVLGHEILQKDPDYEMFIQSIKDFSNIED